jgi:hypothetical protein
LLIVPLGLRSPSTLPMVKRSANDASLSAPLIQRSPTALARVLPFLASVIVVQNCSLGFMYRLPPTASISSLAAPVDIEPAKSAPSMPSAPEPLRRCPGNLRSSWPPRLGQPARPEKHDGPGR